jgi:hypothetical protein
MNLFAVELCIKINAYVANYIGKNIHYLVGGSILRTRGVHTYSKTLIIMLRDLIWYIYYNYSEYLINCDLSCDFLSHKYLNKYREDLAIMNSLLSTLDKEFN